MTRFLLATLACFALTSTTAASEPVPKELLLTPPEETTRYVIVS